MTPGHLIAIVGSDGSGKSTVGEELLDWLQEKGPAELCHLGKQSGNFERAIGGFPLFGRGVRRAIDSKTKQAASNQGPSFIASLTIFAFALRRVRRFRRMLDTRMRGVIILADRFPQLSIPSAIDGPGFGKVRSDRGVAKRLAAIERRKFEWMTSFAPDLVIRLNVDLKTAIARKPDHKVAALKSKIANLHRLSFGGAPIVDIDATLPVDKVVAKAKAAILTRWPDMA